MESVGQYSSQFMQEVQSSSRAISGTRSASGSKTSVGQISTHFPQSVQVSSLMNSIMSGNLQLLAQRVHVRDLAHPYLVEATGEQVLALELGAVVREVGAAVQAARLGARQRRGVDPAASGQQRHGLTGPQPVAGGQL